MHFVHKIPEMAGEELNSELHNSILSPTLVSANVVTTDDQNILADVCVYITFQI